MHGSAVHLPHARGDEPQCRNIIKKARRFAPRTWGKHQIIGRARGSHLSLFLYQFRVPLNRLLYPLRFDPNISLRDGCGTVLQEPLDKGNVIAVILDIVIFKRR